MFQGRRPQNPFFYGPLRPVEPGMLANTNANVVSAQAKSLVKSGPW